MRRPATQHGGFVPTQTSGEAKKAGPSGDEEAHLPCPNYYSLGDRQSMNACPLSRTLKLEEHLRVGRNRPEACRH